MKEETKKRRWIEQQQDKALKIHHKNIERIDKLENKIEHNLYLIYLLHISWNKLDLEQDSEEYGYCMETGEPIGIERLIIRPTAEFCADIKYINDDQEKHFAE